MIIHAFISSRLGYSNSPFYKELQHLHVVKSAFMLALLTHTSKEQ